VCGALNVESAVFTKACVAILQVCRKLLILILTIVNYDFCCYASRCALSEYCMFTVAVPQSCLLYRSERFSRVLDLIFVLKTWVPEKENSFMDIWWQHCIHCLIGGFALQLCILLLVQIQIEKAGGGEVSIRTVCTEDEAERNIR
jgi:hypothetical protein